MTQMILIQMCQKTVKLEKNLFKQKIDLNKKIKINRINLN